MANRARLQSERLNLRPVCDDDEAAIVAALDDIQVVRWLAVVPYPYRPEHFRAWLPEARSGEVWAVETPGGLIGVVSLSEIRADAEEPLTPDDGAEDGTVRLPGKRLELGYWFARRFWGRGYGSEAVRTVLAAHFAAAGAGPVYAHVHDDNIRSESVLRGMGFTRLGRRRYYADALKREVDAITLCLTRAGWIEANPLRIGTQNLLIEPMEPADAAPFRRLVSFPAVGQNLFAFPPDWSSKAATAFVAAHRWNGGLPFRLAIRRRGAGPGDLIGMIGLLPGEGAPELVYAIDPAEGRQGLMGEAVAAFLEDIAKRLDPAQIIARVFTDNSRSAGLLRRQGFVADDGEIMVASAARPAPSPARIFRLKLRE